MSVAAHFLDLRNQSNLPVAGEATAKGHAGDIEITAWSWNASNKEIPNADGSGSGSGSRVVPSLFSFDKGPDRASTRLMQALTNGEIFSKATFTLYEELAGTQEATGGDFHLTVVLSNVVVVKYTLSGTSGDKEVTLDESWELNYRTIDFNWNKGAQQARLTRRPDDALDSAESPVMELVKKARSLSLDERKDLIAKLGSLGAVVEDKVKPLGDTGKK